MEIQVGAYASPTDAHQQLERARNSIRGPLEAAGTATPSVVVNGRRYYRARFTGLGASEAATTCNALRRRQFDCLVASAN
jgi:hypothetical protein